MATVASVYQLTPAPRTPADVFPGAEDSGPRTAAPTAKDQWLMASVVDDAATVVGRVFGEAQRRDPDHTRAWIGLVDGNDHQTDRIGPRRGGHPRRRAVRSKATYHRLVPARRANADTAATYLVDKAPFLNYARALAQGWPIATGVIEGACRFLVKGRMGITGARWSAQGTEALVRPTAPSRRPHDIPSGEPQP